MGWEVLVYSKVSGGVRSADMYVLRKLIGCFSVEFVNFACDSIYVEYLL